MLKEKLKTPIVPEGFYSSWAQYTIQLENKTQRDSLQSKLKKRGIPSMVYYPTGMHAQTAFANLAGQQNVCPVTSHLCDVVLSLPMHPYMTDDEIILIVNRVVDNVR